MLSGRRGDQGPAVPSGPIRMLPHGRRPAVARRALVDDVSAHPVSDGKQQQVGALPSCYLGGGIRGTHGGHPLRDSAVGDGGTSATALPALGLQRSLSIAPRWYATSATTPCNRQSYLRPGPCDSRRGGRRGPQRSSNHTRSTS